MEVEGDQYQLRPMNCPFHVSVYKQGYYSYRDLPLRWAELGTVYRYERSGTMHGLFRVRGFTQDDAHIFCLPDQIATEIRGVLDLTEELLSTFGFAEYEVNLSTRPDKSVGSDEIWQRAEGALVEALNSKGWGYTIDDGGGAFYGPKIDVKIKDALGRSWQCSTVQLEAVAPFVHDVAAKLRAAGARVEVSGGMSVGKAIRNAETAKIPVMCVVGAREAEAGTLSVRTYKDGELGALSVDDVVARMSRAITTRSDF